MSKSFSHIPLPTIRLNAKGEIVRPNTKGKLAPRRTKEVPSYHTLDLAIKAPFAPIEPLTDEQKIQMEQPLLTPIMSYQDIQALSTAVNVAEFALE